MYWCLVNDPVVFDQELENLCGLDSEDIRKELSKDIYSYIEEKKNMLY